MGQPMTEHDLTSALTDLSKTVSTLQVEVVRSVTELQGEVKHLGEAHREVAKEVKEVALNQAACVARTGWPGANARMKKLEEGKVNKKNPDSDPKINIASELEKFREDQTGNLDEVALRAAQMASRPGNTTSWWSLGVKMIPWIISAAATLIGIGIALGRYGTEEDQLQLLHNVREIGIQVQQMEKEKPVVIPLPITPAECESEEIPTVFPTQPADQ